MTTTPPVPPIPDGLSWEEQEAYLKQHGQAHNLAAKSAACYLYGSVDRTLSSSIETPSFDVYLARLLDDCGNPSDPIERMLVEQIALAHHNLGRLYMRAAKTESPRQAAVYEAAAAKLLGEFRRTALALKEYRTPPASRQHLVIQQQNVAENQQVAYFPPQALEDERRAKPVDGAKLDDSGNSMERLSYEEPAAIFQPESEACGRRQTERAEARALDARDA